MLQYSPASRAGRSQLSDHRGGQTSYLTIEHSAKEALSCWLWSPLSTALKVVSTGLLQIATSSSFCRSAKTGRCLSGTTSEWPESRSRMNLCLLLARLFRVQRYGVQCWGDMFNVRQKLALSVIARSVGKQEPVAQSLALSIGKLADLANTRCPWEPIAECPRNVLSNGRIKPSWDLPRVYRFLMPAEVTRCVWRISFLEFGRSEVLSILVM